jgi:hypothetical protein
MAEQHRVTSGRRGLILASAAAVTGAVVLVVAVVSQDRVPAGLDSPIGSVAAPSSPSGTWTPAKSASPSGSADLGVAPAEEVPLGPSKPASISIPAIDVHAEVFQIGKAPDGALAVPPPGPNLDSAAWFENSPTPGQPGPSIVEGHVATEQGGPSIFFDLAQLRPGDKIRVRRADGKTVVFEVTGLREFAKDKFPTQLVYGGDLGKPTLRLVTCSNFDPGIGHHTANLVVFSQLIKVSQA